MSFKDELSQVVNDIQESIVKIGMKKDHNPTVCNNLILVSHDLEKASSIVKRAKESNQLSSIRDEAKMFLNMTDTISHWAKYKEWKNICADVDDIGSDILLMTVDIQDSLKPEPKKKKKSKKIEPKDPVISEEEREWNDLMAQKEALKFKMANSVREDHTFKPGETATYSGDDPHLKRLFKFLRK